MYVVIIGMLQLQFISKCINLIKSEVVVWYPFQTFQNVNQPTTTPYLCLF